MIIYKVRFFLLGWLELPHFFIIFNVNADDNDEDMQFTASSPHQIYM